MQEQPGIKLRHGYVEYDICIDSAGAAFVQRDGTTIVVLRRDSKGWYHSKGFRTALAEAAIRKLRERDHG